MDVGFIGLGAMGLPMARHLIDAGHRVIGREDFSALGKVIRSLGGA